MKTTLRMLPLLAVLSLAALLAAAGPVAAQDAKDHSGADKAAQPATATTAQEPDAPAAAAAPATTGRVTMTFGTGIDRATREIVGEATAFAGGDTVWCRTLLEDLAAPTTVTHAWYHEGRTMARVDLDVGAARWRTWSSKIILPAQTGAWEVKVLAADGTVLGAGTFAIE